MKREIGAVAAKRRVATTPSLSKQRGREITQMDVWVGVDSLGEIHLDTIAGTKEACDNSHSICEGDILLITRPALLLLPPRRGR